MGGPTIPNSIEVVNVARVGLSWEGRLARAGETALPTRANSNQVSKSKVTCGWPNWVAGNSNQLGIAEYLTCYCYCLLLTVGCFVLIRLGESWLSSPNGKIPWIRTNSIQLESSGWPDDARLGPSHENLAGVDSSWEYRLPRALQQ